MELIESTKPGLAIPRNQSSKLYCMIFLQTTFTHLIFLKQLMQSLEKLALQEAVTAYMYLQIKPIFFV